jgi:hypothetical protein
VQHLVSNLHINLLCSQLGGSFPLPVLWEMAQRHKRGRLLKLVETHRKTLRRRKSIGGNGNAGNAAYCCLLIAAILVNVAYGAPAPEKKWHSKKTDMINRNKVPGGNVGRSNKYLPTPKSIGVGSPSLKTSVSSIREFQSVFDNNNKNNHRNNRNQTTNNIKNFVVVSDHQNNVIEHSKPPSLSRKGKILGIILGCCVVVAITINFINLQSDYEELQEFYLGYIGRKMLIKERRLTSRTYLNLLRKAQREGIEVFYF